MWNELKKHRLAYSILIIGLVILLLLFMAVWPDRNLQRIVALSMGVFYSIWGITTHFKSQHISRHIMYEYIGVSVLGTLVIIAVTL